MTERIRRSPEEVLKDILSVGPATWSDIRFTVGLNHSQATRYLPFLVGEGYLEVLPEDRKRVKYRITRKGNDLLRLLNELSGLLDERLDRLYDSAESVGRVG